MGTMIRSSRRHVWWLLALTLALHSSSSKFFALAAETNDQEVEDEEGEQRTGTIIGIDLGTTHSLVAVVMGDKPRVLLDDDGRALTPSAVRYTPESQKPGTQVPPTIGWDALIDASDHAEGSGGQERRREDGLE